MPAYPPQPKWAVYFGTIRMKDGTLQTFTAAQVAGFYNVGTDPYLAVPLVGPSPFHGGGRDTLSELTYFHLKPLADAAYYDAKVRYNTSGAEYSDIDFDSRSPDRWTHRQIFDQSDDFM